MLFSGLAVELSIGQFLHNLGLEHLLEIFDREQVLSSVSVLITVEVCFESERRLKPEYVESETR